MQKEDPGRWWLLWSPCKHGKKERLCALGFEIMAGMKSFSTTESRKWINYFCQQCATIFASLSMYWTLKCSYQMSTSISTSFDSKMYSYLTEQVTVVTLYLQCRFLFILQHQISAVDNTTTSLDRILYMNKLYHVLIVFPWEKLLTYLKLIFKKYIFISKYRKIMKGINLSHDQMRQFPFKTIHCNHHLL